MAQDRNRLFAVLNVECSAYRLIDGRLFEPVDESLLPDKRNRPSFLLLADGYDLGVRMHNDLAWASQSTIGWTIHSSRVILG